MNDNYKESSVYETDASRLRNPRAEYQDCWNKLSRYRLRMYLPVDNTSSLFSLGSYFPFRSWYRWVTAEIVYAWPSIVTLSPLCKSCRWNTVMIQSLFSNETYIRFPKKQKGQLATTTCKWNRPFTKNQRDHLETGGLLRKVAWLTSLRLSTNDSDEWVRMT